MSNRLFLDVHVLQTVPPSCINRDDTGSPKTAVYGGVTRARVSSQSWKKAMRDAFRDMFPQELLALRTKKLVTLLAGEIQQAGDSGDAQRAAQAIMRHTKVAVDEIGTDALFFISWAQVKALARLANTLPAVLAANPTADERRTAVQAVRDALVQDPGIDVALFGRMVANDPSLNTDACAQVAHAISTHKASNEYDYFTAVDDLAPEDNAGAAHIGTVEFCSSTLYRYATVALHELRKSLAEDTAQAAAGFVRAFVTSMPTGKQNTFANRTLPDAVLVTLREDMPINLVGAFEKPISAGEEGFVARSIQALVAHAQRLYDDYAGAPARSFVIGEGLSALGERVSLPQLLDALRSDLERRFGQ